MTFEIAIQCNKNNKDSIQYNKNNKDSIQCNKNNKDSIQCNKKCLENKVLRRDSLY